MKESVYFNSVQLMYYKCQTWWFIYWFSRLDEKEKATINPKNEDDSSIYVEEEKTIFSCVLESRKKVENKKRTKRQQIKPVF